MTTMKEEIVRESVCVGVWVCVNEGWDEYMLIGLLLPPTVNVW
jgi:hypothetical protein